MATVRINCPTVPYSYVESTYNDIGEHGEVLGPPEGFVESLLGLIKDVEDGYQELFPPFDREPAPGPRQNAPQRRSQPPQRAPRGGGGGEGDIYTYEGVSIRVTCPDHDVTCRPSVKNKEMDWDDDVQATIPASWFHKDGGGTHSVYRSQAEIEVMG